MALLTCLSALVTFVALGEAVCPNGWIRYDYSCYLVKNTKLTWHDAKNRCDTMGGQLASIDSAFENHFIVQTLMDIGDTANMDTAEYWVGGNDMAVDGDWVWVSGDRITYTNWPIGEPNGAGGESCLGLHGHYNFGWNDERCNSYNRFICEMPDPGCPCQQSSSSIYV